MTLRISVIFFCLLLDFFQKFGYLLLYTVFLTLLPGWRNGRRSRLKICFPQGVRVRSPSRVPAFFLRKKKAGQRKTAYRFFEKSLAKTPVAVFEKRKPGKEKRRIAFLKKAWQKLPRDIPPPKRKWHSNQVNENGRSIQTHYRNIY